MRKVLDDRIEWINDNGELHRLDGPAAEFKNGDKHWYQNGERHRLDGPAIEYNIGTKCWYQNGKRHRLDGPAIDWFDRKKEWYIKGKQYLEQEWFEMLSEDNKIAYLFKLGEE